MARALPTGTAVRESRILTEQYMAELAQLCTITKPTETDIANIFLKEFRRALGRGMARPSVRAEAAAAKAKSPSSPTKSPTKSRGSKKRGGRAKGRGGKREEPEDESEGETSGEDDGFQRPCTWESNCPCWLKSELEDWNRVLSRARYEIKEHVWSEMTIEAFLHYEGPIASSADVLRGSLLINFLLRRHRCVTRVIVDFAVCVLEHRAIWDAVQHGAASTVSLEYKGPMDASKEISPKADARLWVRSILSLKMLSSLHLTRVFFDHEIAVELSSFMDETKSLEALSLNFKPLDADAAGGFLEALVANKSLKTLIVNQYFLMAREGNSLATYVREQNFIENVEVNGGEVCRPSLLLKAAVESPSLKSLKISSCKIHAEDIEEMSKSLTLRPPKGATAGTDPSLPLPCSLEKVEFNDCISYNAIVEQVYPFLIGGVLLSLTLTNCYLEDDFADAAAAALRHDNRLLTLDLGENFISVTGYKTLLEALEVNQTLKTLAFTVCGMPAINKITPFFETITRLNLSSRLKITWVDPRGVDFRKGVSLCEENLLSIDLDRRLLQEVGVLLDTVRSSRSIKSARFVTTPATYPPVYRKLLDIAGLTRCLSHLELTTNRSDNDTVDLLKALERNQSVQDLLLSNFNFARRSVRQLGQLVAKNRRINILNITFDARPENMAQVWSVCHELREAIQNNQVLVTLNVTCVVKNHATEFPILETLRKNMMTVLEATRFVVGSRDRAHVVAFDNLSRSLSLKKILAHSLNFTEKEAVEHIQDARGRLAMEYFVLTGVVKRQLVCARTREGAKTLDSLDVNLIAYLCTFLKINDILHEI